MEKIKYFKPITIAEKKLKPYILYNLLKDLKIALITI
jgi:hypothetical protein